MNETAAVTVMEWSEHDSLVGSGCIGRVLPGREVRVFDEHQRQVARGDVGELAVRGEGMMEGYFHDPEGTEAAFRSGWFYTGDLVTQDEEGRLYYVRRKNDRVRRSGENISAVEVEQVLMSHPAIVLAAVVPVTDALRGEEVKVYIRARTDVDSDEIDPGQLAAFCETLLSPHKIPRYWEFRAELPLLSSEKVDKQSLRSSKDILANTYDRSESRWLE
jgi:crotonobetaine/carnitine-CoA ligase